MKMEANICLKVEGDQFYKTLTREISSKEEMLNIEHLISKALTGDISKEEQKSWNELLNTSSTDKFIKDNVDTSNPRPVTLKITINGIYGKCGLGIAYSLPNVDWTVYDMLIKPNSNKNTYDELRFNYSYENRADDSGELVTERNKYNIPGLPCWLNEDQYYKMCMRQQVSADFKAKIQLDSKLGEAGERITMSIAKSFGDY